ncbi:hypothetical protein SDC9_126739 [bioreactor metagenome]|uniref:Uncharacterized protein n=1 Tax=bioreactor metagenome TaxID=1076179 RepID=A0A645CRI3_9ZZZZ
MVRFIVFGYNPFRFINVVSKQMYFTVFIKHFRRAEFNTVHINPDRTLHPSAAGFLHASPVLKRIAHQSIGRNGRNGIIPITNFNRIECHLNHRTVGSIFGHHNPIAHTQHIVGRQLNARHKSHDTILEHQHQDGCRCTQSGKQHRR